MLPEFTEAELGHAFSHPRAAPALRRGLRHGLLAQDATLRTLAFLRTRAETLSASTEGLAELLRAFARGEPTVAEALRFPLAQQSIRDAGRDTAWAAAMAGAHLAMAGRPGAWRARFIAPAPLVFGALLTPPAAAVELSAESGRLRVTLERTDGARQTAELCAGLGQPAPEGWTAIPSVRTCEGDVLLLGLGQRAVLHIDNEFTDSASTADECLDALASGWALLRAHAPDHYAWAEEALRAVIPTALPEGSVAQSVSVAGHPSVVYASLPVAPVRAADLMVHEACHQYFDVAQLETLLTNGRDTGMYWSPYVGRERPMDRLLVGYHAFANIALFYRALLAANAPAEPSLIEAELATHAERLGPMRDFIERSPGLTPAGRALFESLRDAVDG